MEERGELFREILTASIWVAYYVTTKYLRYCYKQKIAKVDNEKYIFDFVIYLPSS